MTQDARTGVEQAHMCREQQLLDSSKGTLIDTVEFWAGLKCVRAQEYASCSGLLTCVGVGCAVPCCGMQTQEHPELEAGGHQA